MRGERIGAQSTNQEISKSPLEELVAAVAGLEGSFKDNRALLESISNNETIRNDVVQRPDRIYFYASFSPNYELFKKGKRELAPLLFNLHQREAALDKSHEDLRTRLMGSGPIATDFELDIGTYEETLEPQVRNAVVVLNQKGWPTFESGFDDLERGTQSMGFKKGVGLDTYEPQAELQERLRTTGITMQVDLSREDREVIELIPNREITLDEWKRTWDDIADSFPQISSSVAEFTSDSFDSIFRTHQKMIREGKDTYIAYDFFYRGGKVVEE